MKNINNKIINFCGLKFHNTSFDNISKYFLARKNLITLPSGPGLSQIKCDTRYYLSLKNSTFNLLDSGLFCLLLKIKGINVQKLSGYKFIHNFLEYLSCKENLSILLINPSHEDDKLNINYLSKKYKSLKFRGYVAPIYSSDIEDYKLLNVVNEMKPNFILINIGGGIQEPLGSFLLQKAKVKTTIICSGAALAFFTKSQAPVNQYFDRFYLGWLIRCIFNPRVFIPRYLNSFFFIYIFFKFYNTIHLDDTNNQI